jgi:hypothetical protein
MLEFTLQRVFPAGRDRPNTLKRELHGCDPTEYAPNTLNQQLARLAA